MQQPAPVVVVVPTGRRSTANPIQEAMLLLQLFAAAAADLQAAAAQLEPAHRGN